MLNLALYSDQIIPANSAIDLRLLEMMRSKGPGKCIGYIASGPEPEQRFFKERKAYYTRFGLDLSKFHDLDEPHSAEETSSLFACDAIHLAGGHTAGFLARLKRSATFDKLRNWALNGGLLIGTSAGAILMTPTTATDAIFAGRQLEELEHEAALNLLPFEFFPHLGGNPAYLPALIRYSKYTSNPIIACHDGEAKWWNASETRSGLLTALQGRPRRTRSPISRVRNIPSSSSYPAIGAKPTRLPFYLNRSACHLR
jgi:dipeptidase E